MSNSEILQLERKSPTAKIPLIAAVAALIGIADSVYLTIHHYTAEPVPCSLISGCEMVLTSQYAEMFGIPTAAYGIAAYLTAFVLALLTAFVSRSWWNLFGAVVTVMAGFTLYFLYLQAYVIEAFCQFCLISAATTLTLFIIFIVSKILRTK